MADTEEYTNMDDLTKYKVTAFIYPHAEYRLGSPVDVFDEGSFYRIDGTHIFDKHKIRSIQEMGGKVIIEMTDKTVILEVVM